jgi:hypothetical protein
MDGALGVSPPHDLLDKLTPGLDGGIAEVKLESFVPQLIDDVAALWGGVPPGQILNRVRELSNDLHEGAVGFPAFEDGGEQDVQWQVFFSSLLHHRKLRDIDRHRDLVGRENGLVIVIGAILLGRAVVEHIHGTQVLPVPPLHDYACVR